MKRIRLFVDAHSFDKEHQGTRSFIKWLYTEFSLLNPEIELCFGACKVEELKKELADIKDCRFIKYSFSSSLLRLTIEFPLIVRKHKIDIAHFQYILPFYANSKTIVTTHDVLFLDFPQYFPFFYRLTRTWLFGRSIRKANIKTTVSTYSRTKLHEHFKIDLKDIYITTSGPQKTFFRDYDRAISQQYIHQKYRLQEFILYVARFEPRKNHEQLLRSYLHLKLYETGLYLVLVGHNSMKTPGFTSLLMTLPGDIRKFVVVLHATTDEDLFHFYRSAKVFVYPSLAEGFGLPPIEAAALSIPVICSNTTAMREYSFFGENHVDPDNFEDLNQRLLQVISKPPTAEELSKIAETVMHRFDAKKAAMVLTAAIKSLNLGSQA